MDSIPLHALQLRLKDNSAGFAPSHWFVVHELPVVGNFVRTWWTIWWKEESCARTRLQSSAMLSSPVEARCSGDTPGVIGHVLIVSTLLWCCFADTTLLKRCVMRGAANSGCICKKNFCFLSSNSTQWCCKQFCMVFIHIPFISEKEFRNVSQKHEQCMMGLGIVVLGKQELVSVSRYGWHFVRIPRDVSCCIYGVLFGGIVCCGVFGVIRVIFELKEEECGNEQWCCKKKAKKRC